MRTTTVQRQLCAPGKGLLAIDESPATCGKRLATIGLSNTAEHRRRYRELLLTAPGIERGISGIILHEETLHQPVARDIEGATQQSVPVLLTSRGIVPGIKVDRGVHALANSGGELWTAGLDGLAERCGEYYAAGARFAKWRAVVSPTLGPSELAASEAAHGLGRYAAIAQSRGLVPIIEPEVALEGSHSIDDALDVALDVWQRTFRALAYNGVLLEAVVLKPSMVTPGIHHPNPADPHVVADYTLKLLRRRVPAAVPGIFFLSGGLSDEAATLNLNAMQATALPWHVSFSFARALQGAALCAWGGEKRGYRPAQRALLKRVLACSAAQQGACGYDEYHAQGRAADAAAAEIA